jgi:nuclear transport factor 2 (NTF2) superfamily protein
VKNAATKRAPQQPLSTSDATEFLIKYKEAWETRNAELAAGLFTRDARYKQHPFAEAIVGREAIHDYWAGATARQEEIRFTVGTFIHSGYMLAAEWTCTYKDCSSGDKKELVGMLFADFYGKQVRHFREYWHSRKAT